MKQKAEYRSAVRSRKLIREAFLALLQEKEFSRITVTDIVNRADINRGTFYAHYTDIHAIVEEIEEEITDRMLEVLQDFRYQDFFRDPIPVLREVSAWIQTEMEQYRALIRAGGAGEFLLKLQRAFFSHMSGNTTIPDEVRKSSGFQLQMQFLAAGTVSLYQSWFLGELHSTPEEITLEVSRLMKACGAVIYGQAPADGSPQCIT